MATKVRMETMMTLLGKNGSNSVNANTVEGYELDEKRLDNNNNNDNDSNGNISGDDVGKI